MKKIQRFLCLLLVFLMILPLASCKEEPETTTAVMTDAQAVERYINRLKDGYFAEQRLYDYEDLSVYLEVGKYLGLEYKDDPYLSTTITDERLQDYITQVLVTNVVTDEDYTELTEGVVQKFDVVTLTYKGYVNGEYEEEASAENQTLLVGSHNYIPGFEEGLVGAAVGKEFELTLNTSPYYPTVDFAGKEMRFEVTVLKIQRPEIPELNIDTLNEVFSTQFESEEIFRQAVRLIKDEEQATLAYERLTWYLELQVLNGCTLKDLPQKELEHYATHYVKYYAQFVPEGSTMEAFCQENMGISYDTFLENANLYAQEAVKTELMILSIAKKEGLNYTDEQLQNLIYGLYEQSQGSFSSMESFIDGYVDIYGPYYFPHQILQALVREKLHETAIKVE